MDFGLARRLDADGARQTRAGQPLGTPAYMAPEQVAGAVRHMGTGCDIYTLGVLLYQMLTGRLPFAGPLAEVLDGILRRPPVPPSRYRPDLDPRLERVCLKALQKPAADRYASMRDLGAELAEYLGEETPPRPARRRPLLLYGCLAAGLLLAGGAALAFRPGDNAPASAAPVAVDPWGTIRIQLDGKRGRVEVRLDGERVAPARFSEPLRLLPGTHELRVRGERIRPMNRAFTVQPGENPVLRVPLVVRDDDDDEDHDRR